MLHRSPLQRAVEELNQKVERLEKEIYRINDVRCSPAMDYVELVEDRNRAEYKIKILTEALERIAEYGEDHMGYVNATIDGMPISKYIRKILNGV